MDIICLDGLPFLDILPGTPLRIEVKNAIHFGPQNLHTYPTVLARLDLGTRISWLLDGYWGKDDRGHVRRIASLETKSIPLVPGGFLEVFIDLKSMGVEEVHGLYVALTSGISLDEPVFLP